MDNIIVYRSQVQIDPQLEKDLKEEDEVSIWAGQWKNKKYDEICPFIKEWNTKQLRLGRNHDSMVIKEIQEISFPKLYLINLIGNNLTSIEGLSRIRFLSLTDMYIWENFFINLKDFRKNCFWPKFKLLSMNDNLVLNGADLTEANFGNLNELYLDFEYKDREQICDIRWIMKMRSQKLSNLSYFADNSEIESSKRINRLSWPVILTKRYSYM